MLNELEKRLDLDLDEILESPKLRLALSPAELDKQLLELYNRVTDGPGGDILRIIGGGQEVALQSLYLRRQAFRQKAKNPKYDPLFSAFSGLEDDDDDHDLKTASQWVNRSLRRNLKRRPTSSAGDSIGQGGNSRQTDSAGKSQSKLKMSLSSSGSGQPLRSSTMILSAGRSTFAPKRSSTLSFSLLI
jgi:hypothetical protein